MIDLNKFRKLHFIGIGGSGMFPIAKMLKSKGFEITGSDVYESDTLQKVKELGIPVALGHSAENIKDQDAVIFSAAIKETNPERMEARNKGIPQFERCEILGILVSGYKNSVAVAGTHGKTTTTSMITTVLLDAGKDPSAIIGGSLRKIGGNSSCGNSDVIICEACEYVDSFLQLYPAVSVITNADADHLDYFKTHENMKKSYKKFAQQTSGCVFGNGDDVHTRGILENISADKIFYGLDENNDYIAKNIEFKNSYADFDVYKKLKKLANIKLKVPGEYNVYNALAAFAVCSGFGIEPKIIAESLGQFAGLHRRFEILSTKKGITIADDFAHHPAELTAVLTAAKNMDYKKVWAVFQPHTFSRTYLFLNEFAEALSIADRAVISEILPVRETNIYGVDARDLAGKIPNAVYLKTFEEIADYVSKNAEPGDLIITLGGGNPYVCAKMTADLL